MSRKGAKGKAQDGSLTLRLCRGLRLYTFGYVDDKYYVLKLRVSLVTYLLYDLLF